MRITDIDSQFGYYDPLEDELSKASLQQTRRKRLTLRELNKIKKIQATRRLEMLQRQDTLELIYGTPEQEQGGPGGMPF